MNIEAFLDSLLQKSRLCAHPCVRVCVCAYLCSPGQHLARGRRFGLTPGVLRARHIALISEQHICVPVGYVEILQWG